MDDIYIHLLWIKGKIVKEDVFGDLGIIVDEEQGAAYQLMGGEEGRAGATVLDQLQAVQVHVLEIGIYGMSGWWFRINKNYKEHVMYELNRENSNGQSSYPVATMANEST